jgi:hypothetical protein
MAPAAARLAADARQSLKDLEAQEASTFEAGKVRLPDPAGRFIVA